MFLLSSPGVQSVFFFCCAPLGAATFRRGQSKKKHHPGCCFFFFAPAPAKGRGRRSPAGAKTQHPGWCFFFSGPAERSRRPTGRKKKKHFAHPGTTAKTFLETNATGHEQIGATTKKTPAALDRDADILLSFFPGRLFRPGPACVFFFLLRPRADAHSLTAGLSGDASRRGGVFFFLLRPRPDRGGVFIFLLWPRPEAHSLTVAWGDFGKARVFFFFCCRPAEPGEPITKNVWCTTSGLKRPGGATAKKTTSKLLNS